MVQASFIELHHFTLETHHGKFTLKMFLI